MRGLRPVRGWLPAAVALLLWAPVPATAAGFQELESQVHQFTLANGLTFLVVERHEAPVFSARTYVDVGGVDEVAGITGLAHMFEHMAFKGTQTIGTTDYKRESVLLDKVDAAWAALAAAMFGGEEVDSTRMAELQAAFDRAQEEAGKFVVTEEFSKILEDNGAPDLNASTGMDRTQYICSLPSNRLELWARMEGDRLTQPVLREFYKERAVVQEERRFQESSPMGRLFSDYWMSAFLSHPYGYGLIGFPSDLKQITRGDAMKFFHDHYVAKKITVALVGDVTVDRVRTLAEKYFSGVSAAPPPPPLRTVEPAHDVEIRVTREEDAQPAVMAGYLIPSVSSKEWPAYDLLADILGSGRSCRLYERLVKKDRLAADVGAFSGFPGSKYPNLLLLQAIVAQGSTPEQVEKTMYEEVDRLIAEGPTQAELDKVRSQSMTSFIRSLRPNGGLAGQLARYQGLQGDWHKLFQYLERLQTVQTSDVQRAAAQALRPENRVVGVIRKPA